MPKSSAHLTLFVPWLLGSVVLAVLPSSPGAIAQEIEVPGCQSVEALTFMLGRWREETQGTVFEEQWTDLGDGTMKGHAESYKSDGTEHFQTEDMVIRPANGTLVYAADPDGDGTFIEFTLTSCEQGAVVFENPDHDFPKRLAYRRDEEGMLHASVTDLDDQGFELSFRPDSS